MSKNRIFYSPHANFTTTLDIEEGKKIKIKRCLFRKGVYYALEANDKRNELGKDEYDLLMKQRKCGVSFFNAEDWAERSKSKLADSERSAINAATKGKDAEIDELKKELAKLQKENESKSIKPKKEK